MIINYINFKNKLSEFETILNNAVLTTLQTLNVEKNVEINLQIVNKHNIKKLNRKLRNINKVTDVLSFPNLPLAPKDNSKLSKLVTLENYASDIDPLTHCLILGDIALCYPVIKKQAKLYGNTINREMCYMVVHGTLHLLGFDHYVEAQKKRMRKVEEEVLTKIGLPR